MLAFLQNLIAARAYCMLLVVDLAAMLKLRLRKPAVIILGNKG
jgi:hypothetical protein